MSYNGIVSIITEFKKRIYYLVGIFFIGAVISFSYMGGLIKKIETDMFWKLNPADKGDVPKQLFDISQNLSSISRVISENNSLIADNLTIASQELQNISHNLILYKPNLVYLAPMEILMLEFKMSILSGLLIVMPFCLFYLYKGAKYRLSDLSILRERKLLILSTIAASIALFLIGAGYAYFYMIPFILDFLYKDAINIGIVPNFTVYEFISFVILTTVILGIAFELPVILTFFVHLGIVSRDTLSYYRRHAYIVLLIVAAWITPDPTMFTQVLVALPFIILYELSLIVMRLTGK